MTNVRKARSVEVAKVRAAFAKLGLSPSTNEWDRAITLSAVYGPAWQADSGADPRMCALLAGSLVAHAMRPPGDPFAEAVSTLAAASSGHGPSLSIVPHVNTAKVFSAIGLKPYDIAEEARKSLHWCGSWAALKGLHNLRMVADETAAKHIREEVASQHSDDESAQRELTAELVALARRVLDAIAAGSADGDPLDHHDAAKRFAPDIEHTCNVGTIWSWDEALAVELEQLQGNGRKAADRIRSEGAQRLDTSRMTRPVVRTVAKDLAKHGVTSSPYDNRGPLLGLWASHDLGRHPLGMPWLKPAAWALWHDKVRPGLEKRSSAVPLKLPKYLGTGYAVVSVVAAPLGEFVGGEGKDEGAYIAKLAPGNDFVEIPEALLGRPVYASQGAILAFKGDKRRGRQAAFNFGGSEHTSDAHGIIDALASCQLDLTAGKVSAIALADAASRRGGIILDSPDRWIDVVLGTRFDSSGAIVPRTIRRSDARETLAQALAQLDLFMLLLPGSAFARAFSVQGFKPGEVTSETRVGAGCSPSFLEMDPRVEGKAPGTQGGMLVHMASLMAHSGNEGPRHFRMQLALSSIWNRAHTPGGAYDPSALAFMSDRQLAQECNALSMQSVAAIEGSSKADAERLRKDRKSMRDALATLEAMGVVGKVQDRKRRGSTEYEYRVHPPEAYREVRARGAEARLVTSGK